MPIVPNVFPLKGGCACSAVRYQVSQPPFAIHACHCTRCQRESGAAYALNAMFDTESFKITSELSPTRVPTPAASGKDQEFFRCPTCQVALFSYYQGGGDLATFVRSGTLDRAADPEIGLKPDVHIYTSTKQPWLKLEDGVPQVEEFYQRTKVWSEESLKRFKDLLAKRQQRAAEPAGEKTERQAKY